MQRIFPLLLVLSACDGEDDLECDFYGFDLLSAVERPIRVEVDAPNYGFVELLDSAPVELHSEQSCGGKVLYPSDLPPLIGRYLDGDGAEFSVELPEEAWTGRRIDNARGYPFYRAEILEEYLIQL